MFLKDIFFPKVCLGCGFLGSYLCLQCSRKLKLIEKDRCLYCHEASLLGLTHPSCCKKLSIDAIFSLFYYDELMKKIIKNIKYKLATDVFDDLFAAVFSQAMERLRFYKKLTGGFLIQPIPLHPARQGKRGFNQAQVIGEFLGKFLKLPVVNFLQRKKPTSFLAQIKNKKERYLQIRGAFAVKDKSLVFNKKIILVDDVVTTGSTVKEAGKSLKRAGAKIVYVFSLAKK
ncbi:MAG: ComF family protein [Microgenomates group bacterium]